MTIGWINLGGIALIGLIVWWFWLYRPRSVTASDEVVVRIDGGSYQPARIELQAQRAATLAFERIDPSPCAEWVLFPDLQLSQSLAVGEVAYIALPPLAPGVYPFHCQMKMYRGELIVG